jgi:hypothetical protein
MTKKQNATEKKTSKSADGKIWVMSEAKLKAGKKGSSKKEKAAKKTPVEKKTSKRIPVLSSLEVAPKELMATYKGTGYKATVNEDGTITVNGKTFNSPSRAGKEITGREVDGWIFWSYEVPGEGLKKLNALRKETV